MQLVSIRATAMWITLSVFAARVLGQFESLLLTPRWLPPFRAWESGLVPYSVLLPVQVVLIAAMAVFSVDHTRVAGAFRVSRSTTRRALRWFALLYFLSMLIRLIVTAATAPHTVWDRGLIPILAHWDLAGFVLLVAGPRRAEHH